MNRGVLSILFFLSGACGLIYEVLWTRLFSSALGHTYLSISIIVASFMFGLFAGSWLIGRSIGKCQNELIWYAILELVIGSYSLLFLLFTGFTETVFNALYAILGKMDLLYSSGKFMITLSFIFIPTSAMGATLPLIVQYFTKNRKNFGENVSLFYSINTIGGAMGALAAGFYVIENFGVRRGLMLTSGINIAIGLIVFFLLRRKNTQVIYSDDAANYGVDERKKLSAKQTAKENKILYLSAAGLSGFTALSYEMIWTRGLEFLIHNSTYSLSVILFVFLVGIAIGSYVAKKNIKKSKHLHYLYGLMQIFLGLYAIFTLYLLYSFSYTDIFQKNVIDIIYDYSYNWLWEIVIYALICCLMFLIPTILMGILFPFINELSFKKVINESGKTVSAVYAINTIGAIAGPLITSFFLLPAFGIKTSILLISLVNLMLGIIFIFKANLKVVSTLSISTALFFFALGLSFEGQYLFGRKEQKEDRVLFYKEGLMSTVKVYEQNKSLYMSIDGVSIASNHSTLLKKEKLIAHLPFFVKSDIKKILAVGLASGISVGSMALHRNVENIDCVELIKSVFSAAKYFSEDTYDIFNNKKINLIYDDIYAYMKFHNEKYDLISSDGKLGPLYRGNTIMLSSEYYELCKSRLTKEGLFIQWIPIITPYQELRVLLETLKRSFKYMSLFYFYPTDIFMLASESPIILDKSHMDDVFSDETIKRELERFDIRDSFSILSSFIGVYVSVSGETSRINSFDTPLLEFEYQREWKKSRRWEGGYRAKNLEYLTENYEKTDLNLLHSMFKNTEKPPVENIFKASLLFFKGATTFFKTGNLTKSFREYTQFKESLKF